MFIIVNAAADVRTAGGDGDLSKLLNEVGSPITMTSIVNAAIFAMMLMSDIGAVKYTAVTALFAICLLWLSMMTSFVAMISIDAARQGAGRHDVACCMVKPDKTEPKATGNLFVKAYSTLYRPFISNKLGHVFVCVVTLALFITACIFLNDMPIGLDLDDFFPIGTQVCACS